MMRQTFSGLVFCIIGVFGLSACGGGGGDSTPCAAPALDASGTWCITLSSTSNTCGNPLDTTPYASVFTQNGSYVTATSQGATYAGTICGNTATMTGTNFGFTTTVNVTFPDSDHATGSSNYTSPTCHGTDAFLAVRGTCP